MTDSRASTDTTYDCVTANRQHAAGASRVRVRVHEHSHPHAGAHAHDLAGAPVHGGGDDSAKALRWALVLTAGFLVAEVVGGIVSNSLTLLADAGHMLTDVGALALSLFVTWLARQPAMPRRTYGYLRWEILAALLNGATLLAVSAWIIWEAVGRLRDPEPVQTGIMLVVAALGLVVNAIAAKLLHGGAGHSLNMRGAYLHVVSDLLGSVAAVAAALCARFLGWSLADPIASILMSALIVRGSWSLVRESLDILLESTPAHINVVQVRSALEGVLAVESVHDLHVWTLTSGVVVMSAHAVVTMPDQHQQALEAMTAQAAAHGIHHTTIQIEGRALAGCRPAEKSRAI